MFFLLAAQSVAKQRAAITAKQRLGLAASMAAREGGGEIDRRWRLLELEAQNTELSGALLRFRPALMTSRCGLKSRTYLIAARINSTK